LDLAGKAEGLTRPLGEELLRVHKNYQPLLATVPGGRIKGAAHITGGGLIDNIPRVLPPTCDALIDTASWKVPPIFRLIQRGGDISAHEMFEVFNMGIGMVLVVARHQAEEVATKTASKVIGQITPGSGRVLLT
jgi:phosphoribosylformylglycinamidine cyclo-ligase